MNVDTELVIEETMEWIEKVVIGQNFCPFAGREFRANTIRYEVVPGATVTSCVEVFSRTCDSMNLNPSIETALIILPDSFADFHEYLALTGVAEKTIKNRKLEGIFQVASFHPLYLFAGSSEKDAANYTNRSPYPMLHILREQSITLALKNFKNPENIPVRNIEFTRKAGLEVMQKLLASCFRPKK